ncbi:hypothetical protein SPOG_01625 [Schizosaccharomyces cryophilus OY26]|uniref:Seven transmembrane receptor-like protein n=1 Tax=Schizosaccharomyces cryophilus (strain OY26 / ATCC MYA-4695 / CBS 11777 / NBRC 106824 / NRRL Y48691) TaxID=653667 RepID=S9W2L6_SCHCR|nr:uncharacterized protein SPOG_01625 [Schizosaccharomyces cryophilus OY26]EPY52290.1 hypothetical protein SPOG_01625 [Schizosaccharomyces cryophilus OY26]
MGLMRGKSWLLWLLSFSYFLQIYSYSSNPYIIDDEAFQVTLSCKNVKAKRDSLHVNIFSWCKYGGPTAVTHFNAKDWECALGSLIEREPLSAFFSQLQVNQLKTSIHIPPEKREVWTGPLECNKTSVMNGIISLNNSIYKDFKINESGVYCIATRPLTSLGSRALTNHDYYYYFTGDPGYEPHPDYFPIIVTLITVFLLTPACFWIYALLSQPAKVLPIQYGLLIHVVNIAIGITINICDDEIYLYFKYPVEVFVRRLLLFLASFGIGVWRPVEPKLVLRVVAGLSFLLFFQIVSTLIDFEPIYLIDEWLNNFATNIIWLSSIYMLFKERDHFNSKSERSAKVCKHSLIYCVAVFTLFPLTRDAFEAISFEADDIIYWVIRYFIEIVIPCYIWYPSQNEQIAYKESVEL